MVTTLVWRFVSILDSQVDIVLDSDIRGANTFNSPWETEWLSILVRTGVYKDGDDPSWKPRAFTSDVYDAVQWALKDSEWDEID